MIENFIDFTSNCFKNILTELNENNYSFITYESFINNTNISDKFIILRHDIDKKPKNALVFAEIESSLEVKASYYFRIVKQSFDTRIIKQISDLGHEIGYHYEDLSLSKGDFKKAIILFQKNLKKFRDICPIKTICMHGSPLQKWDNRDIWKKYNYRDYGIIGEPYFDIDFNKIFYITDTGRKWNGNDVSIRDKVNNKFSCSYKSTNDIIKALKTNSLPKLIMMTTHPQRWNDDILPWSVELVFQNIKNIVKFSLNKIR